MTFELHKYPRPQGHIRKPMPRKGGNNFYKDTNDYTKFALTLCGAPVTSYDTDFRYAGTKAFATHRVTHTPHDYCETCLAERAKVKK